MGISQKIIALHRYYIWANKMRTHFEEVVSKGNLDNKKIDIEARIYMSYWYGGLYVVIEGWQELKLTDTIIDNLLISGNVSLLKRYRNGVFHFQKEYNDKRFTNFMEEGTGSVDWVHALNKEFGRYFLQALNGDKK